jgi:hypothetical protein
VRSGLSASGRAGRRGSRRPSPPIASALVEAITTLAGEKDVLLASVLEVCLVKRVVDGKTEYRLIVGRALERNVRKSSGFRALFGRQSDAPLPAPDFRIDTRPFQQQGYASRRG